MCPGLTKQLRHRPAVVLTACKLGRLNIAGLPVQLVFITAKSKQFGIAKWRKGFTMQGLYMGFEVMVGLESTMGMWMGSPKQ